MPPKTMQQLWDEFAQQVALEVPPHSAQYLDMRATFYAGAWALFHWFMAAETLDEQTEVTERDLNKVGAMHDEIEAGLRQIVAIKTGVALGSAPTDCIHSSPGTA